MELQLIVSFYSKKGSDIMQLLTILSTIISALCDLVFMLVLIIIAYHCLKYIICLLVQDGKTVWNMVVNDINKFLNRKG